MNRNRILKIYNINCNFYDNHIENIFKIYTKRNKKGVKTPYNKLQKKKKKLNTNDGSNGRDEGQKWCVILKQIPNNVPTY